MSSTSTLSRRGFLRGATGLAAASSLAGCYYPSGGSGSGGGNVAAGGVGSGFAYEQPAITREQASHVVTTPDALTQAIQAGTQDTPSVVWVPPDAAIDMTGRSTVDLENVVIASSRSVNHPGGLIYSNTMGESSAQYSGGGLFNAGENVRITGVRLRGPTSNVWDHPLFPGYIPFGSGGDDARDQYRDQRMARGITINSRSVQLDNCEIFGWATQGVLVSCPRSYGRERSQSYPQITNCSIHDCALSGLGYGVEINVGHPVIEQCFFNGCRHMIAGEGYPDAGYTVSNSFLGPAGSLFPLDMHYLGENIGGASDPDDYRYRYRSGGLIRILNSTVAFSHVIDIAATDSISQGGNPFAGNSTPALSIGGVPDQGVVVKGNRFVHSSLDSAISQSHTPSHVSTGPQGFARFDIANNQLGVQTNFSVGQP